MKTKLKLHQFIDMNPHLTDEAVIKKYKKYLSRETNTVKEELYNDLDEKCKQILNDINHNRNIYYLSRGEDYIKYIKLKSAYIRYVNNSYLIMFKYNALTVYNTGVVVVSYDSRWNMGNFINEYKQDDTIEPYYNKVEQYINKGKKLFNKLYNK